MIATLLMAAALHLAIPVKSAATADTIWWRTDGANVTEHRSGTRATCSLWLFDPGGSISFTWEHGKPTAVAVLTAKPLFEDAQRASLQFDDHPSGESAPVTVFGTAVTLTLDSIEDRLLNERLRVASLITLHTDKSDFALKLNPTKMPALMSHVAMCRKAVPGA